MTRTIYLVTRQVLMTITTALGMMNAGAQTEFESGSDGSDGALDLSAGPTTFQVPPDGVFNFTTINIPFGKFLRFTANANNTPVYLLATGDVEIGGKIFVNGGIPAGLSGGKGGPGGFDGGSAKNGPVPAGAGHGPGAGLAQTVADPAGLGGHATSPGGTRDGASYGSPLLMNPVGGSGGGGSDLDAAGGGGGALVVASNTRINLVSGQIDASGGRRSSGGAVRLVAPELSFLGNDLISLGGGDGASPGRARIDTLLMNFTPTFTGNPSVTIGKFMTVRPPVQPTLSIIDAAGTAIAEGAQSPASITLPFGSPTTQTVRVRARDFNSIVPIRVVATPESGEPTEVESQIDNSANNPAELDVDITLPVNIPTRLNVYTR